MLVDLKAELVELIKLVEFVMIAVDQSLKLSLVKSLINPNVHFINWELSKFVLIAVDQSFKLSSVVGQVSDDIKSISSVYSRVSLFWSKSIKVVVE